MMTVARDPYKLREQMMSDVALGQNVELSRGQKGVTIGALNRALGCDEYRYLVFCWLFTGEKEWSALSSSSLSNGEWNALYQWVGSYKDEHGKWRTSPEFSLEAKLLLNEAMKDYYETPVNERGDLDIPAQMIEVSVAYLDGYVTNVTDENGVPEEHEAVVPDEHAEHDSFFPRSLVYDEDDKDWMLF